MAVQVGVLLQSYISMKKFEPSAAVDTLLLPSLLVVTWAL